MRIKYNNAGPMGPEYGAFIVNADEQYYTFNLWVEPGTNYRKDGSDLVFNVEQAIRLRAQLDGFINGRTVEPPKNPLIEVLS